MPEIRIDGLPAAAKAELNHVVPAMRGGVASKLTLAQIIDILAGSTSPFSVAAAKAARTNLGIDAAPYVPVTTGPNSTTDWNTITTFGWYSKLLHGMAPNGMGVAGYFFVFVLEYPDARDQYAFPYRFNTGVMNGAASIWARRLYSGTWEPWAELSLPKERLDGLYVPVTRTVGAGAGLTNGGALSDNIVLNVGAGDGVSVSADAVAVDSTVLRTAGNQSIAGTKNFTGDLQSAGNPVAAYYSGSDAGATDLPLGHAVHIVISTNTTDRNATQAVYLAGGNTTNYSNTSGGAQLSGTWRSRGAGSGAMLAQRVA